MKWSLTFLTLGLFGFALTTCEPPTKSDDNENIPQINIIRYDIGPDYVSLDINLENVDLPVKAVVRNSLSEKIDSLSIFRADTLLHYFNLSPNTFYDWTFSFQDRDKFKLSINHQFQTLSNSTRNFIWNSDTLGNLGSFVHDILVINEDSIWVVGDINKNPFSKTDMWNAAVWNGEKWDYKRIGQPGEAPVKTIQTISYINGSIWMNAESLTMIEISQQGTKYYRMEDIYFFNSRRVGHAQIENNLIYLSGSFGLFGSFNIITKEWQSYQTITEFGYQDMYALQSKIFFTTGGINSTIKGSLYEYDIHNRSFSNLPLDGLNGYYESIWANTTGSKIIVSSSYGLFEFQQFDSSWSKLTYQADNFGIYDIDGKSFDLWLVGGFGHISHYNGSNWQNLTTTLINWPINANATKVSRGEKCIGIIANGNQLAHVIIIRRD